MNKFLKTKIRTMSSCCLTGLLFVAGVSDGYGAVKDQSRINQNSSESISGKNPVKKPDSLLPDNLLPHTKPQTPVSPPPANEGIDNQTGEDGEGPDGVYDINDIPALEQLELTLDIAKRALDGFADIGTRYDDKGLYDYSTLQEFVKKTEPGKQLEKDIKKHGFKDVVEWNTAIMNVSFAFGAIIQDQEADIRHQIEAVKSDKKLSDDKKQRIIASLNALIPTKENISVVEELQKLPAYSEKLQLLNAFE